MINNQLRRDGIVTKEVDKMICQRALEHGHLSISKLDFESKSTDRTNAPFVATKNATVFISLDQVIFQAEIKLRRLSSRKAGWLIILKMGLMRSK